MANAFGVDSLHINVEAGDAAVHLQLQLPTAGSREKPVVLKAVLIDGGDNAHKAPDTVKKVFDEYLIDKAGLAKNPPELNGKYTWPDNKVKFDAVIITHWDSDHYKGLVKLMIDDVIAQGTKNTDDIQISFFKYGSEKGRKSPQTTFYCPYWNPRTESFAKAKNHWVQFKEDEPGFLTFQPFVVPRKRTTRANNLALNRIAKLDYTNLLGMEFFSGSKLQTLSDAQRVTPTNIFGFSRNVPLDSERNKPGMFCVAANKAVLGPALPSLAHGPGSEFIIGGDAIHSPTNASSIAAMIILAPRLGPVQISHYFGGDKEEKAEKDIARWASGFRVTNIKASHHGSATSFPVDMFRELQPRNIIISAGGEYGHPRYELLYYIAALNAAISGEADRTKIYTMGYPYWFAKDANKKYIIRVIKPKSKKRTAYLEISTKAFDDNSLYRDLLTTAYENPDQSPIQTYTNGGYPSSNDLVAKLTWIIENIEARWDSLSGVEPFYFPETDLLGKHLWTDSGAYVNKRSRVLCHRVETRFGSSMERPKVVVDNRFFDATKGYWPKTVHVLWSGKIVVTGWAWVYNKINTLPKKVGITTDLLPTDTKDVENVEIPWEDKDEADDTENDPVPDESLLRVSRATVAPKAVSPTPSPPVVPSVGYYFCSSGVVQSSSTSNAHNIDAHTDLDTFVSNVHLEWIGFESVPSSTTATSLRTDDEWGMWWSQVFSNGRLKAFGDSAHITSFNLTCTFASTALYFDTLNVPSVFGLTATQPQPLLYPGPTLIMGLGNFPPSTSSAFVDVSISAIFHEVGLDSTVFGIDLTVDFNVKLHVGSSGERNAVWFVASNSYDTVLRLVFHVDNVGKIDSLFNKVGLALVSAQIIVRQTHKLDLVALDTARTSALIFWVQVRLGTEADTAIPFSAVLIYDSDSQESTLIFQCDFDDAISRFINWIEGLLHIKTGISQLLQSKWVPKPRRVSVTLDADHSVTSFALDFEVDSPFGGNVAFLFTFKWAKDGGSELSASLWPKPLEILTSSSPALDLQYEEFNEFRPRSGSDTAISIVNLLPGNLSIADLRIPHGIPTDVASLGLVIRSVPNTPQPALIPARPVEAAAAAATTTDTQIEFYASLQCAPPAAQGKLPPILLTSLGLDVMYTFGSGDFKLSLQFKITLAADDVMYDPAVLSGTVDYSNRAADGSAGSTWQITAMVHDLHLANLFDLFETESQHGVMALIGGIEIVELDLTYDYDSSGQGSHFLITGTLLLGQAQLELEYEHFPDTWEFSAELTDPSLVANPGGNETLNGLLSSISSDFSLPDFVGNISLPADASVLVDLRKTTIREVKYIVFQFEITIGAFDAVFIQYKADAWAGPKRVFRALMGKIDLPGNVPIIDKFEQPFDEMHFMYVQDKSTPTPQGILRGEMDLLNEKVTRKFIFKEMKKPDNQKPVDPVIVPGLHFVIVILEHTVPTIVLDHVFGSGPQTHSLVVRRDAADDQGSSSDTSMGALHKTLGPVTISNIGIQFKGNHLIIKLDATVKLGPIELDLLGAGLDLDFSGPSSSLLHLPSISFVLSGLGFGYSKPPVVASGLFEKQGDDFFVGGVIVAFQPYLFMASGCYGIVDDFKTVALFCKLAGPLVELEFAEISAICGGFGYNSLIKFPTIDQIFQFPFVKQDQIGGTPLDTLKLIGNSPDGWVKPTRSSLWLAAGLTADACKLLTITAVVVVDFQPTVKLGIFADAVVSFPPAPTPVIFTYVELGIAATVDFAAGSMLVEGSLAPTSYVYTPACHLTGGFAMGYWFGNSGHAGDWVFTIGGYHPAYTPPSHYPVPQRLAISWNLSDALSIHGEAYFALTPKCCMGGGSLKASLSLSPLYAYFEAWADFLIKFDPFYFIGDIGVSVGVQFTLDLWICTIHISIDIGAMVHLEGPPMHGFVHVDFWVFGFDIYFGDQHAAKPVITQLLDFYKLLKQQDIAKTTANSLVAEPRKLITTADPAPTNDPVEDAHRFNCVGGLFVPPDQSQTVNPGEQWQVRAGSFQFSVDTVFAAGSGSVLQGGSALGSGKDIYSRPMELSGSIDSQITVEVYTEVDEQVIDPGTKKPVIDPVTKKPVVKPVKKTVPNFRVDNNIKNVPIAMWGQYTTAEDPLHPSNAGSGNQIGTLLDGTSTSLVPQLMGLTLTRPPPKHSIEDGKIAPFDAAAAMSEIIDTAAFQPFDAGNAALRPKLPANTDPKDPEGQWTKVPTLWKGLAASQEDGGVSWRAVDAWAEALKWQVPGGVGARVPGGLVGGFEDYFLAVPMVSVS